MVDALSLQYCGAQAILAQDQLYLAEHCLDEESTIEEVSTRYDQGVFPIPSCNTPYLFVFLEGRHVDRHSSAIVEGNQHQFAR